MDTSYLTLGRPCAQHPSATLCSGPESAEPVQIGKTARLHWIRSIFGVALLGALLAGPTLGQNVLFVDNDPNAIQAFTTLQAAVDAALTNDVIVVRPGSYLGQTVLAAKAVDIIGLLDEAGNPPEIKSLTVSNPFAGDIALRNLSVSPGPTGAALVIENCNGQLLLENVRVHNLWLKQSLAVAMVDCQSVTGVIVEQSRLDAYDTSITGGAESPAVRLVDSSFFASGCQIKGGAGSDGNSGGPLLPFCTSGGPGGPGISLTNSTAHVLDSLVLGGAGGIAGIPISGPPCFPGPNGAPSTGSGLLQVPSAGAPHRLDAGPLYQEQDQIRLKLSGIPGEHSFIFVSPGLATTFLPTWNGAFLLAFGGGTLFSTGVIPANGTLELSYQLSVPSSLPLVSIPVQALFVHPSALGPNYLGSASVVRVFESATPLADCDHNLIDDELQIQGGLADCNGNLVLDLCELNANPQADCNQNGQLDQCDLASGASPDMDGNGVPDECQALLRVPQQYPDIASAVAAAAPGSIVLLSPGTYTGSGNRDVLISKVISIIGAAGAANTTIDLQGLGRAFYIDVTATGFSALRGLTIRNGSATGGGGAIFLEDGSLKIAECGFRNCQATLSGGAIAVATISFGALAPQQLRIQDAVFLDNQAAVGGGAIYCSTNANLSLFIDRSRFERNRNLALQAGRGGVIYTEEPAEIRNCLFSDNISDLDGAALYLRSTDVVVKGSTFYDNKGGKARDLLSFGAQLQVSDCIFAKFSGSQGKSIFVEYEDASIRYSLLPAGANSIGTFLAGVDGLSTLKAGVPFFVSPSVGDFHLLGASLGVNSGDPSYVGLPGETDLDGAPRVQSGVVDMGCYEQ